MRGARWLLAAVAVAGAGFAAEPPLGPGELVIADRGGQGIAAALYRLSPGGTPRRIETSEPLVLATAVAIDRDGTLVVADVRLDEPGRVVRVDPTSGALTTIADGWRSSRRTRSSSTSVATCWSPIWTADRASTSCPAVSPAPAPSTGSGGTRASHRCSRSTAVAGMPARSRRRPTGDLAVVDLGFSVFTGDGALTLVDATTGVQRTIATSTPLLDPSGIVVEAAGTMLVTEATNPQPGNAAVLAIEPRTGTVTTISTGAPIADPRGLAITNDGDLVVADSGAHAVYRIAMPDHFLEILAEGPPLRNPWGIAVVR
jgi:sugar lactone lactonase YvrE